MKIDYSWRAWWLVPTLVCTPTAIFATVVTWPSKMERYAVNRLTEAATGYHSAESPVTVWNAR